MNKKTIKSLDERFPRPEWLRRINSMADSTGGAANMVSLNTDEMISAAKQSTGLSDFGDNIDGDWHGRLVELVGCLESEAKLNVVGRLMVKQEILRSLHTRLYLAKKLKDHPAILDEEIKQPIIITGTGRSGTSITLELLSLDPNCHAPIAWQGLHPAGDSYPGDNSPEHLRSISECEAELWMDTVPELASIHESRSDLPEECITLQKPSFAGMYWWVMHNLQSWPIYFDEAMQYYKVALQAMQFGRPESTWVLKTPIYLPFLDNVFATFPDAWIVLNHRDPIKTVASGISTFAAIRRMRSDDDDMEQLLATTANTSSNDLMVDIHRRRQTGELPDQFVDLQFSQLMENPTRAIESLYQTIGRTFETSHAQAIDQYLQQKPRDKHGKHGYSLEGWGVDESTMDAIHKARDAYCATFNVASET